MVFLIQITYTGNVEWRTRDDQLVQFKESSEANAQSTSVTVLALSPDTEYRFAVSAVTELGAGAEKVLTITTRLPLAGIEM